MTMILESEDEVECGGCISELEAMKIGRGGCPRFEATIKLSAQECTAALAAFLKEGWLIQNPHKNGHYSLGVIAHGMVVSEMDCWCRCVRFWSFMMISCRWICQRRHGPSLNNFCKRKAWFT